MINYNMKVKLKKHNPNWRKMYEDEALALRSIFKMDLIDIQHVGSTSIRSVDAKPIIDIVIGLETFNTGEKYIDILTDYGYRFKGSLGKSKRYFYTKLINGERTFNLHVVEHHDTNWFNQILFRDYLIEHEDIALQYNEMKHLNANKFSDNLKGYTDTKSSFIINVIEKAKAKYMTDSEVEQS